jgi:hypothetical protein
MNTPTLCTNYIHRSLARSALLFVSLLIGGFGFLPGAQGVSPPPDGGYPAEGQSALLSLTTDTYNTAVGVFSRQSNLTGNFNTAIGAGALLSNTTGGGNTANGTLRFLVTPRATPTQPMMLMLLTNTIGSFNTADGVDALSRNTIGNGNTAISNGAL